MVYLSRHPFNWNILTMIYYKPFRFISSVISTIWKLSYLMIITPVSTTIRCFLQLITLPINIPLYIIFHDSVQSIMDKTLKGINADLIMILFQYTLVLFISGILLGSIIGSILGFIHIHTYMRDHIFEFQFGNIIKRSLRRCYNYLINLLSPLVSFIKKLIRKYYSATSSDISNDISINVPMTAKYDTTFDTNTRVAEELNKKISPNESNNKYSPTSSIPLEWLKNFDVKGNNNTDNVNSEIKQERNTIDMYDSTTVKGDSRIPSKPIRSRARNSTIYQTPPGSPKSSTYSNDSTDISIELLDSSTLPIKTSTLKRRKSRGKK